MKHLFLVVSEHRQSEIMLRILLLMCVLSFLQEREHLRNELEIGSQILDFNLYLESSAPSSFQVSCRGYAYVLIFPFS